MKFSNSLAKIQILSYKHRTSRDLALRTARTSSKLPITMGTRGSDVEKSEEASNVDYCGFDIGALPEELFVYVLMFVPAKDVVKRCSLVCKHWLQVSRHQSLWGRKCREEAKYVPGLMGPPPDNFMVYYFKNPYTRNLIRNSHAESLEGWKKSHERHSPQVEELPYGADPIADHIPAEEIGERMVQNWVTSYRFSSMTQIVRLLDEGCSEAVLDQLRPPIQASAWCAARWDCGSKFNLVVVLLDKNGKEIESVEKEKNLDNDALRRAWHKVEHRFTGYKPGVRSVAFSMGGIDTKFWAGNYGSKFTLPCLRFVFNN